MTLSVLGISTSPRAGGNSDRLLGEAVRGAESAGAAVRVLALRDLRILPCNECYACARTGRCCIEDDDFGSVLDAMLVADRLIFATPVFFMSVCAQAKVLIDRCQCLWARKYLRHEPLFADGPRDRRGLVVAVGGSKSRKMFESVRMTMRYWFDALEVGYFGNLFVNGADGRDDVAERPEALAAAVRLGADLANPATPMPEKPVDAEIFVLSAGARPEGARNGP